LLSYQVTPKGCLLFWVKNVLDKKAIEKLIEPIVGREGFELVDVKLGRFKQTSRLQLFAYSPDGITIDDCARLSRLIEPVLENENVFDGPYVVEISSPGLDRPLVNARDFARRIGDRIIVQFKDASPEITGILAAAGEENIEVNVDEEIIKLPLAAIKQGKIVI